MIEGSAIVYTGGLLDRDDAKTAHGLIRAGRRFRVLGLIDERHAGRSVSEFLPDQPDGLPIRADVDALLADLDETPRYCVLGVAFAGGRLPDVHRAPLRAVLERGIDLVSGLHEPLGDDPELRHAAAEHGARIFDIRQPPSTSTLSFWSGAIYKVSTPKIAVLGIDCAIGKRTTAQIVTEACRADGIATEMIYTGQTGWLQGSRYGFILDATPNDFVSGELERAIVECHRESAPDLIVIEGQSSLHNPSGPCGPEFLLSGNVKGVILQHVPGREFFEGFEEVGCRLPDIDDEIALIRHYGAEVLAITINDSAQSTTSSVDDNERLAARLGLPVLNPLVDDPAPLLAAVRSFMIGAVAVNT
jgi:uncharacterized NAD-dependent epimerase/dehydratase family protein